MRSFVKIGKIELVLMESVSEVQPQDAGRVVIAGSHAGQNIAEYALRYPLRAAFFNDAGVGKDNAGIVSLDTLGDRGVPAAAVAHSSARIGDPADVLANGVITHANQAAREAGVAVGDTVRGAVAACFAN